MTKVAIQTRVSEELKQEAEAVLEDIGLTTTEAIRLFLKQVVNTGGLPFQPKAKSPNVETLAAMLELERREGDVFQSPEALFADWED